MRFGQHICNHYNRFQRQFSQFLQGLLTIFTHIYTMFFNKFGFTRKFDFYHFPAPIQTIWKVKYLEIENSRRFDRSRLQFVYFRGYVFLQCMSILN
jgi:hypothetical protein